jgi:Raf kinase inhibitor-like YbhB/YbcL family protein
MPGMEIEALPFGEGEIIPRRYTADGANISPSLRWRGVPTDAKELALVIDDPDAQPTNPIVHWVAYHIPAKLDKLPEGITPEANNQPSSDIKHGRNDFGKLGYAGPVQNCTGTHHYHFHLYALDEPLDVPAGSDAATVRKAMCGHVLAEADCVGAYRRPDVLSPAQ